MSKARAAEAVRVLAFGAGVADEVLEVLAHAQTTGSDDKSTDNPAESLKGTQTDAAPAASPDPSIALSIYPYPFGGYDWRVLEVQGSQALLLSDKLLEIREYHKNREDISWEQCTLRKYLNNDFYNKLPSADRSRIAKRIIQNNDNPWSGTDGGSDTYDYIFLLSIEEVVRYFGNSGQLKNKNPNSKNSKYRIHDQYNFARIARKADGMASWWWLRSPGRDSSCAAFVHVVGYVDIDGLYVRDNCVAGVRPALWLNL